MAKGLVTNITQELVITLVTKISWALRTLIPIFAIPVTMFTKPRFDITSTLRYTSSYCPTISALRVVPTHAFFYFNYANISWKFNNIMNADEVVYSTISFKKLDTKPFHKEFLKKTRNLYYYLGGSRTESIKIEGNCYLTWVPVGEGCMMIDQKKCKEGFRLHRYQCHDRGKFFKNYKGSWRCHFFPDTDMSFNHVRRMREEWVNILWWDEKRNKE